MIVENPESILTGLCISIGVLVVLALAGLTTYAAFFTKH